MARPWRPTRTIAFLVLALVVAGGCGDESMPDETLPDETLPDQTEVTVTESDPTPAFTLTSAAFADGAAVPDRHTCRGDDVSPPLAWSDPPAGTVSFAVVMDDPDAVPVAGFVWDHWVLHGLPPDSRSLPEAVPTTPTIDGGGTQGENSFGRTGYGGPCPPPGQTHTYAFTVFALDVDPDPAGPTKADLLAAIDGHVLAEATLAGTFTR